VKSKTKAVMITTRTRKERSTSATLERRGERPVRRHERQMNDLGTAAFSRLEP
jgi:hypothetical protein